VFRQAIIRAPAIHISPIRITLISALASLCTALQWKLRRFLGQESFTRELFCRYTTTGSANQFDCTEWLGPARWLLLRRVLPPTNDDGNDCHAYSENPD
jgi:hypothetical protein